MTERRRVLLWGSSVFMAAVAASLSSVPSVEVSYLPGAGSSGDMAEALASGADVVVYDHTYTSPDRVLALLRARPGMMMIGLDMDSDRALVLSEKQQVVHSAQELLGIITVPPAQA